MWLGKQNFSLGLTTQTRGSYGNNAVLNKCQNYDIQHGYLTPIKQPSIVDNIPTLNYTENGSDYCIEFEDNYYTFSQFKATAFEDTTVESFFGTMTLKGRPVISDKAIIYPTDKGLFSYEPHSVSNTSKVRYLSFMSPDDYNDSDTYKPSATNGQESQRKLFSNDSSKYTPSRTSGDNDPEISISGNVATITIPNDITIQNGFTVTHTLENSIVVGSSSKFKGWFVYDMKIEGDTQTYASSTIFENGDATLSGYELVLRTNDNNTNNDYVMGITKLEPVAKKWFRCISYVELPKNKTYNKIILRNANYYKNDKTTKIYIGVGDFDFDKWKVLSNKLFTGEEGKGSYKDKFKRTVENFEDNSEDNKNVIKHYKFDDVDSIAGAGWVEVPEYSPDYTGDISSDTIPDNQLYDIGTHYTKRVATTDFNKCYYYASVQPNCFYEFGIKLKRNTTVRLYRCNTDGSQDELYAKTNYSGWGEYYVNGYSGSTEIFSANSVQFKIEVQNNMNSTTDESTSFTGVWLRKTAQLPFYKTTRVLYYFNEDDLSDSKVNIHNCKKYSYSYCGRNSVKTIGNIGTINDKYKLMISNPSKESNLIADNPFATTEITLTDLPKVEIRSGFEKNVDELYGKYFTNILLYKSIVYGQTDVEEDFTFCGKIKKSWTTPDTSETPRRFPNNYVTKENDKVKGFVAKDDCPYDEDSNKDTYYDIDSWHSVGEQQEMYNDFLKQANCVCHLNGRLYCGNIDNGAQKTALAVSNYNENWIFPTSVDEGSVTGTGTQTDNLHAVSTSIEAIHSVNDRIVIFYDKEILTLYGNDFYSSNGFGVNTLARLNVKPKSIANTIRELVFSDGKDFYITNGNSYNNISHLKIDVKDFNYNTCSSMFYDNKYYFLNLATNEIYVYDLMVGGWYTIKNIKNKFLIDDNKQARIVYENNNNNYKVFDLYGTDYVGDYIVETMYQIISDGAEFDVEVNDFAFEMVTDKEQEIDISMYSQGEFIEEWNKKAIISPNQFRYNKVVRFNKKANAIKQVINYNGSNPPTIHSIGVVRNDTKARK